MEACSCTLQARLHQVENARSREMQAHGELVRTLVLELDSRRTSEAELRLTAAKLRTDNCRLEAELCAANMKAQHLREQLDAQRRENIQREDELKDVCTETERQLQACREKNDQLLEQKQHLHVELSDLRSLYGEAKVENLLHLTKIEESRMQASAQTADIEKLSAQVRSKQQEIETVAVQCQLLLEDLAKAREQQITMQGRIKELEHDVNRAMVTRNRAFNWRRKRQDAWENRLLSHGAFLAWKSIAVQARADSATNMARSNQHTLERLRGIEQTVLRRCSESKEVLSSTRQACARERTRMVSLRDEICRTELPKLLELLEKQQMVFDVQLKKQRECFDSERDRLEMSRHDVEQRAGKQLEAQKQQQHAILQACTAVRRREFQRRTFSAWKEFFLRAVAGQATHTAMVFQSLQSKMPAVHISDAQRIQSLQPLDLFQVR